MIIRRPYSARMELDGTLNARRRTYIVFHGIRAARCQFSHCQAPSFSKHDIPDIAIDVGSGRQTGLILCRAFSRLLAVLS